MHGGEGGDGASSSFGSSVGGAGGRNNYQLWIVLGLVIAAILVVLGVTMG